MKTIITLPVLLLWLPIIAQPVIPPGNNNFLPGDAPSYHYIQSFSEPPSGQENAFWDLSGFEGEGTASSVIVPAHSSAPEGSTISEQTGEGQFTHYYTSNDLLLLTGVELPQLQYICQDPLEMLHYPITFGSEFQDAHECQGELMGSSYTRTGSAVMTGSSWGTLSLPYGEFDNVLMVRIEMALHEVWDDPMGGEFDAGIRTYQFVKAGMRGPLMIISVTEVNGQANGTTLILDGATIDIEEAMRNSIGIELMPNPATDNVVVVYSGTGSGMSIELRDGLGRLVRSIRPVVTAPGILREVIDVTGLPSGPYLLRVMDEAGAIGVERLVVQ